MKLRWTVFSLAMIVPTLSNAGDASRYTLSLSGEGVRFTPTMNGIPIGPSGNPAQNLAYSLDAFIHSGDNLLVITVDRPGTAGAAGLVVLGPATGFAPAPRLAEFACNPAAADGVPACGPHQVFSATVSSPDAPDLRLWHASPPPSGAEPAKAIAASLAKLTNDLAGAAKAGRWESLFYLTDLRQADMMRANPAVNDDAAAMAAVMRTAPKGRLTIEPPPEAADLQVAELPGALWAVQRVNGSPLLRIAVGQGPGAGAPDPEAYGDLPERWNGGVVQLRVAVFGFYDGEWQLVR